MTALETSQISDFELWVRTGRRRMPQGSGTPEAKFNPWHDIQTGEFTFRNAGRYFGLGSTGAPQPAPRFSQTGTPIAHHLHGARFGGGGATGAWSKTTTPAPKAPPKQAIKPVATVAIVPQSPPRTGTLSSQVSAKPVPASTGATVFRDDQVFKIDALGRTTFVGAHLRLAEPHLRSRRAQSAAGIPDRKPTDDGGHYIAPRFKGPTDAFNHFAQNRTINRGRYRVMEDGWAKALKEGKKVYVEIRPIYVGVSKRPFQLAISATIDGETRTNRVPND